MGKKKRKNGKSKPRVRVRETKRSRMFREEEERNEEGPKKKKVDDWTGNRYSGFEVPAPSWTPDLIDSASITPEAFFERYVKTRTPVILSGHAGLGTWAGHDWPANGCARLVKLAGQETVKVEVRGAGKQAFGKGREEPQLLSAAVASIAQGYERFYLTTQELPLDEEDRPALCAAPVKQLLEHNEFTARPPVMGRLVPFNYNLWLGASQDGTSSGLHHDFHDNLYVLLAGRKHFRLFAPADAERMYTVGPICRVHPNGRINYQHECTEADGANPQAMEAMAASTRLDAAMARAHTHTHTNKDEGDFPQQGDDEEAIEAALEAVLAAEMEGDFDRSFDDRVEPSSEEDEEFAGAPTHTNKEEGKAGQQTELPASQDPPKNFSRIGTCKRPDLKPYPLFQGAKGAQFEVLAGQMLYLPAGWFHEVTSLSSAPSAQPPSSSAATSPAPPCPVPPAPPFHMAFNYWFHPPDALDFDRPYSSTFWQAEWDARKM